MAWAASHALLLTLQVAQGRLRLGNGVLRGCDLGRGGVHGALCLGDLVLLGVDLLGDLLDLPGQRICLGLHACQRLVCRVGGELRVGKGLLGGFERPRPPG